jgi:hypothetical protein
VVGPKRARVTLDREVRQVVERFLPALGAELAGEPVASNHLGDLQVEQMRSVQGFAGSEDPFTDGCPPLRRSATIRGRRRRRA